MAGGQIISQPVLVMRVGVDKSGPKQKGVYVKSKDPKVGGVGVAVLKEKQRWRDMLWYTDVFFLFILQFTHVAGRRDRSGTGSEDSWEGTPFARCSDRPFHHQGHHTD